MNKKAAIELSMTTIIVIIIGVTLLSLGLVWVKNTFGQVGDLTDESFRVAQEVIQRDMAPDDTFYVSGYSIKAKHGKFTEVYAGVQYFATDPAAQTTYSLSVTSDALAAGVEFILPTGVVVNAGERKGIPFGIKVPSNIPEGETYSATVTATSSVGSESEVFLIEIT
jgi:hypothetical protein